MDGTMRCSVIVMSTLDTESTLWNETQIAKTQRVPKVRESGLKILP